MGIRTTRVGVLSQSPSSTYFNNIKQPVARIVNTNSNPVYVGGSIINTSPINNRIFTPPFNNIFG